MSVPYPTYHCPVPLSRTHFCAHKTRFCAHKTAFCAHKTAFCAHKSMFCAHKSRCSTVVRQCYIRYGTCGAVQRRGVMELGAQASCQLADDACFPLLVPIICQQTMSNVTGMICAGPAQHLHVLPCDVRAKELKMLGWLILSQHENTKAQLTE